LRRALEQPKLPPASVAVDKVSFVSAVDFDMDMEISEHGNDNSLHQSRTFHSERDAKEGSSMSKVDEFGRVVREGVSNSNSDDLQYERKHGRRGRSSSRSLSPREDRWRSGPRRKEMRSRSRSWSPKRQRFRSKSPPPCKNPRDFIKKDHPEVPKCFHFRRDWCSHGVPS
jgi:hypothetical protein